MTLYTLILFIPELTAHFTDVYAHACGSQGLKIQLVLVPMHFLHHL